MADQRVLQRVAATIRVDMVDQDGAAAAAAGAVTVTVVRADGTVVATDRAATLQTGSTGTYEAALTAAETATLDQLTCTWKDGATTRAVTVVDVVGRYMFTIAEARNSDPTLIDAGR